MKRWILIATLACVAGFVFGYMLGSNALHEWKKPDKPRNRSALNSEFAALFRGANSVDPLVSGTMRVWFHGENGRGVEIAIGERRCVHEIPEGEVALTTIIAPDAKMVFFLQAKLGVRGWDDTKLVRLSVLDNGKQFSCEATDPLLSASQASAALGIREVSISALHSVSPDGKRLLLDLHEEVPARRNGSARFYTVSPYFYDVTSKKLIKVQP